MDPQPDTTSPPPAITRRDLVVAGIIVVAIVTAVLLVRSQAADAPSSTSQPETVLDSPALDADAGCREWVRYWTETSGVGMDPAVLSAISNCRQGADGEWFAALGGSDMRLPAPLLDPASGSATLDQRNAILDQLAAFRVALPAGVAEDLDGIFTSDTRPVADHIRDGVRIGAARTAYNQAAADLLADPAYADLAAYVDWLVGQRVAAGQQFVATCLAGDDHDYLVRPCSAMPDQLSVSGPDGQGYIPFPWDLETSLNLDAYLAATAVP